MDGQATGERGERGGAAARVHSIQLLRGIAAFLVALVHLAGGFAAHLGCDIGRYFDPNLGAFAVSLFFVISGYVMVVSSRRLPGGFGGARIFAVRRAVRILPPFWIATVIMGAIWAACGLAFDWGLAARSLTMLPAANPRGEWDPWYALWPGWTLFYEGLFYAIFAAALAMVRGYGRAIVAVAAVLGLLALGGIVLRSLGQPLPYAMRLVVLLFVPGLLLGYLSQGREGAGRLLSPAVRWACAAAGAAVWFAFDGRHDLMRDDLAYVTAAGIPAALAAAAVVGGPFSRIAPRFGEWFGDTSFAVYLLHLPIAQGLIALRIGRRFGPWGYLAGALVIVYLCAWGFHRWVERPMTARLNRVFGGVPRGDDCLQQSGV